MRRDRLDYSPQRAPNTWRPVDEGRVEVTCPYGHSFEMDGMGTRVSCPGPAGGSDCRFDSQVDWRGSPPPAPAKGLPPLRAVETAIADDEPITPVRVTLDFDVHALERHLGRWLAARGVAMSPWSFRVKVDGPALSIEASGTALAPVNYIRLETKVTGRVDDG